MNNEKWTMPEWMEPYRDLFHNTGGNTVERFMNSKIDMRINMPMAVLQSCVESQVFLLETLHNKDLLNESGVGAEDDG